MNVDVLDLMNVDVLECSHSKRAGQQPDGCE